MALQPAQPANLPDRFQGCLVGLAIGDALGGHFESQSPDWLQQRFRSVDSLFSNPPEAPWYYTDDTQMALGVAQTLLDDEELPEAAMLERFATNYERWRGYGRGVRMILETFQAGEDHRFWVEEQFPGGSFGNGAAMRVAPIGLAYHRDLRQVARQAEASARPTHVHPLGIEGAQLLAVAVAWAVQSESFERNSFFDTLLDFAQAAEFREKLAQAREIQTPHQLAELGNGIAAQDSVVTAIACFTLAPDSYRQVIGHAILGGGDTDTIAAMAGAISGAYLGRAGIPAELVDSLEDNHHGRGHIIQIAEALWDRFGRG